MKNWIYILLFLSLHSCKLYTIGSNSKSPVSAYKFLADDSYETLNDDNSDNKGSSKKSTPYVNLFTDFEEEDEDKVLIITLEKYNQSYQDYNTVKANPIYLPRDLPDKYIVPIYIFCNSLII